MNELHQKWLRERGISDKFRDFLEARKFLVSVDGALKIVYPDIHVERTEFYRLKMETGEPKYQQPTGTKSQLYFTPYGDDKKGVPLVIVEGELKALALKARVGPRAQVVGIGGVWNWAGAKDRHGARLLIDDFKHLRVKNRRIYLVFDSDIAGRVDLAHAEAALARALRVKGAEVKIVILAQDHKGLDDWLVQWGANWEKELGSLFKRAVEYRGVFKMEEEYAQVYTYEEMMKKDFKTPPFLAGDEKFGLAAEGMLTFIHGGTNLGKTYLASQLAYSISTGNDFLSFPTAKSRVLYLQGELPPGLFAKHRLAPLKKQLKGEADILYFNWTFDLGESSRFKEAFGQDAWVGFNKLEDMIATYAPKCVVVDPLQSYHNLVESSNDQQRELMKRLKRVALNYSVSFILVDHDRKDAEGVQALRGGATKGDLADTVLGLMADQEARDYVWLCFDKVRYISKAKPSPWPIKMNGCIFEKM